MTSPDPGVLWLHLWLDQMAWLVGAHTRSTVRRHASQQGTINFRPLKQKIIQGPVIICPHHATTVAHRGNNPKTTNLPGHFRQPRVRD
jgi:hypothetical protein